MAGNIRVGAERRDVRPVNTKGSARNAPDFSSLLRGVIQHVCRGPLVIVDRIGPRGNGERQIGRRHRKQGRVEVQADRHCIADADDLGLSSRWRLGESGCGVSDAAAIGRRPVLPDVAVVVGASPQPDLVCGLADEAVSVHREVRRAVSVDAVNAFADVVVDQPDRIRRVLNPDDAGGAFDFKDRVADRDAPAARSRVDQDSLARKPRFLVLTEAWRLGLYGTDY